MPRGTEFHFILVSAGEGSCELGSFDDADHCDNAREVGYYHSKEWG